jgi:cell division initiation protein
MKVTAIEIRQREFALRFRGYDPTEVDSFLELAAGQIEDLLKENVELREALARQEQDAQHRREGEDDWKKALLTVQQINEDLMQRAQQRAQAVLADAERQAHQLLAGAERRRQALAQDVQLLTCQKRQLIDGLRHLLSQHLGLLRVQEEQDERRQCGAIPGPAVTTLAVPQAGGDAGHTAAFTEDPVHTGTAESAQRRAAAHVLEESQR